MITSAKGRSSVLRLEQSLLVLLLTAGAIAPLRAATPYLSDDHPKVEVLQQVLDDLVLAVGDGRTPPGLHVLPRGMASPHQVVWIDPQQNLLTLQEEVYDLCVAMGPDSLNALAFLLGHELAHRYKDHDWVADFVRAAADLDVGKRLDELDLDYDQMVARETEADYWGGFYSAIAGYPSFDVAPEALGRIYSEYGLDEEIPGYPTLVERKEMARRSGARLQRMVPIFEAGHLLAMIRRFEEASRCFDHIAVDFQSREILNNAGVTRTLEALSLFREKTDVRFVYPFEFDASTRLQKPTQKAGSEDQVAYLEDLRTYRKRLHKAAGWFEKARARDAVYVPAYVNLAAVRDLLGQYDDALFWSQKAIRLAREQQSEVSLAHTYIVRAVARIHSQPEELELALQDFERARVSSPLLVELNLAAVERRNNDTDNQRARHDTAGFDPEQIAGVLSEKIGTIVDDAFAVTKVPRSGTQLALDIYSRKTGDYEVLVVEAGYSAYEFIETAPGYGGASARGIRIGDRAGQVDEAYGSPSYVVAQSRGVDRVYQMPPVIFRAGADNLVSGWVLYNRSD